MKKKQKTEILIYGAGGSGREIAWLIQCINKESEVYNLIGFIDDNEKLQGKLLNDLPVLSLEQASLKYPNTYVVGSAGNPKIREIMINNTAKEGFKFKTIIHPNVEISPWAKIDVGTVIFSNCIISTNVTIGKHTQINFFCNVSHDSILGDFTTLAPGVHISGWVHIGRRVYIGTGAVIINGSEGNPIIIGDDAVIGAGACVIKSIPAGKTAVGVPAQVIK